MDTDLSFLNLSFGAEFHDTDTEGICYKFEDTFEDPEGDFGLEFPSTVLNDLDKQGESDVLNELLNVDSSIEECKKICVVCKKTFKNIKQYYGHLRIHAKQGIWLCDKCPDLRFKSRVELSKHSSKHQYHCYLCNQCFSAHSALVTHILNLHYKQRLHKCDQCDASFQKTHDLKKHMDIHKGKKKHVCGRCLKKFSDVSNLYTHMLTHQDEKIFACGSCKQKYAQLSGLVRHCRSRNHVYFYSRTKKCNVHANYMVTGSSDNQPCDNNSKKSDNTFQGTSDLGRNVDNLINDILSADTNKKIVNDTCVNVNDKGLLDNNITADKHKINDLLGNSGSTAENLLQIELFEEMNKLHGLINANANDISSIDPENLIPSEFFDGKIEHLLDFENFQTTNGTHIPNTEIDSLVLDRNVHKFEEDIFNTWCQSKDDRIPEDILNMVDEHTRKIDEEKNQRQENEYASHSLSVPKLTANLVCTGFEIPKQMSDGDTDAIENYKSLNNDWQHLKTEVKSSSFTSATNPIEVALDNPSLDITNKKTKHTTTFNEFSKSTCLSIDSSMASNSSDKTKKTHEKIINKLPLKLSVGTEKHGSEMRVIIEPVCANNSKSVFITNKQVPTKEYDITTKLIEAVDSSKVAENFKVSLDDTVKSNTSEQTNKAVKVEDCATIFESDVDLEARSDLAHNLTQLIGKNHVQYISNEEDDTFVIVLNNNIDAEKLTDILFHEDKNQEKSDQNLSAIENKTYNQEIKCEPNTYNETSKSKATDSIVKSIRRSKKKSNNPSLFKCQYCKKVFFKKDNWRSHIGTHAPTKCQFRCVVCGKRFAWRATLQKHMNKYHVPRVHPAFGCQLCDRQYPDDYRLRQHVNRDHLGAKPYVCTEDGCSRKFFKKHDLTVHQRGHAKARPYKCDNCPSKFGHISHLRRHERLFCRSRKSKIKPDADGTLVIFLGDLTARTHAVKKVTASGSKWTTSELSKPP